METDVCQHAEGIRLLFASEDERARTLLHAVFGKGAFIQTCARGDIGARLGQERFKLAVIEAAWLTSPEDLATWAALGQKADTALVTLGPPQVHAPDALPSWLEACYEHGLTDHWERPLSLGHLRARARLLRRADEAGARHDQMRALTNAMPALVAYLGTDYRYRFVNEGYSHWFGRPARQIVGHSIAEIHGDQRYRGLRPHLERASTGEASSFELADDDVAEGRALFLCGRIVPDRDLFGRIQGYALLLHDVTESKRAALDLERARQEAEAASQAKSAFLANMSHEIRTPLGVILGFTELLCDRGIADHERANFAEIVRRSGKDLARLIDDILDLSKVEAGHLDVELVPIVTASLLDELNALLRERAAASGVDLVFERAAGLAEQLLSDPTRLRQILINLVGNALKFTERGQVHVHFGMCETAGGRQLVVRVRDSGCGMTRAEQKRLFQPFMQADHSTTRRFGGTGLGLALTRRLAQALGGDVELESSAVGKGSTFVVTVLAGVPSEEQLSQLRATKELQVARRGALSGMKILLVEDAADNQLLIRRVLVNYGAEVELASNGLEGVEKALSKSYDVVLMDLQMPKLDGYQATTLLRARGYQRPIIALTAHAMKDEREKSMRIGCDDHVTKPISRDMLVDAVARYRGGLPRQARSSPPRL